MHSRKKIKTPEEGGGAAKRLSRIERKNSTIRGEAVEVKDLKTLGSQSRAREWRGGGSRGKGEGQILSKPVSFFDFRQEIGRKLKQRLRGRWFDEGGKVSGRPPLLKKNFRRRREKQCLTGPCH